MLTRYYRKAQDLRNERRNEELWIQGAYIYEALCCASPLFRSLTKNAKPAKYRDKPYPLKGNDMPEKKATQEEKHYNKQFELFTAKMEAINRQKAKHKEVMTDGE